MASKETSNLETRNNREPSSLWIEIKKFFHDLIDLREGLDKEGTIIDIKNNKRMKGANAWLLMCSIMVASLGLDLNSPAVIIGAMLISPLMSPILGIGLSIGTNDKDMLLISLQHFAIAIGIALATSWLYFKFTPLGDLNDQILTRTKPTFLDVLIAFFGGIAGIISYSRKEKSSAIPGVAIATALMPPLCVAGYFLAKGEWLIMLNAFYLFFLNAVFVALATYLIVRYLDFPSAAHVDEKETRNAKLVGLIVSIALIVPSFFILSSVLKMQNQKVVIESFLDSTFPHSLYEIDDADIDSDSMEIRLYLFEDFHRDSLPYYIEQFNALNCQANLDIIQLDGPIDDQELLAFERNLRSDVMQLLDANTSIEDQKDRIIRNLRGEIDSLNNPYLQLPQIKKEISILFPKITSFSYAPMKYVGQDSTSTIIVPTINLKWAAGSNSSRKRNNSKMADYLKYRFNLDTIVVQEIQ